MNLILADLIENSTVKKNRVSRVKLFQTKQNLRNGHFFKQTEIIFFCMFLIVEVKSLKVLIDKTA